MVESRSLNGSLHALGLVLAPMVKVLRSSGVRIRLFGVYASIALDVVKGCVRDTPCAPGILDGAGVVDAIHKLLFA